jgi:RNA polymerase sigma-70 factor (sigma-E family)
VGEEVHVGDAVLGEFDEYVAASWPRLVRAAMLLGCTYDEAEDTVQTALTRCLVKWSRVRRAADRDAYVHRILINTYMTSKRRKWHGEQPTEHLPDAGSDDATDEVVQRDSVRRALLRLPLDQRVAVTLRYFLNLSEAQMATTLNVAPGTVKSRLSRGLKALSADPDLADTEGLS